MQDWILIVHLPGNTHPESPGKESQGCPTVHIVKHIRVPHNSLEGVTLNAIRISSFTAKQHTTRIIKVRSHKAAPTVCIVRRIQSQHTCL